MVGCTRWTARNLVAALCFIASLLPPLTSRGALGSQDVRLRPADETPVYAVDWESGFEGWSDSTGVWQVGVPLVGPPAAHGGTNVAGTVLDGNYPSGANAFLTSLSMTLPAAAGPGTLWLRFWHWFSLWTGDVATVEVSAADGPWQVVGGPFVQDSAVWTQHEVDLTAYAGQSVRIAFHLLDDGAGGPYVSAGWYVDDVSIIGRALASPLPVATETFESGIGDWYADQGQWEVGAPTAIGSAHGGNSCAGTVLGGNYASSANSRLISPSMTLPTASGPGTLGLRFWHWFSLWTSDVATVEVSAAGGPWQVVAGPFVQDSAVWTQHEVDLTAYAGQSVRIAFHLLDDSTGYAYVSTGWYVDDVSILSDPAPVTFVSPETFDDGYWLPPMIGRWYADAGVWEVGQPTAGPGVAHSGTYCAGTVLAGNYPSAANSRLISPATTLPASPVHGELWLSFWHWYSIHGGDLATVEISVAGGPWQVVAGPFTQSSAVWTECLVDLKPFAGQSIRIAFHMLDDAAGGDYVAPGWYVDNIAISEGPAVFNTPESFEGGVRGWYASDGVWEVGVPVAGPGSAADGTRCLATVLGGNYPFAANSRFISPTIVLPTPQQGGHIGLRYSEWVSLYAGDTGMVEVSAAGGPWVVIDGPFGDGSAEWTSRTIDLTAYAGQSVRIAFHLLDDAAGGYYVAPGWYIDNIQLNGVAQGGPSQPEFTSVAYTAGAPQLTWSNPAAPFDYLAIFGSRDPDFVPDLGSRIALLPAASTSFADAARPGWDYHYKIAGVRLVDGLWRDSAPASPATSTDVGNRVTPLPPLRTALLQNGPNPFNPATTIRFSLAHDGRVSLSVFDLRGRRVETLLEGDQAAGEHTIAFRPGGLASGVYVYQLRAGGVVQTKKMVLAE